MEDINALEDRRRKMITEYVEKYCTGYYFDPETEQFRCHKNKDEECRAINSQYSVIDGNSICRIFQELQKVEPLILPVSRISTDKACILCGKSFEPRSNRQKYCDSCNADIRRKKARKRKAKQRQKMIV